jgi:hypothetical protein
MLDWYFSVEENKVKRNELRNSTWFLKATSDFAAGAKHFKPRVFHDTVSKAFVTPGWFTNYFPKGASPIGSFGDGAFIICINNGISSEDTDRVSAFSLATMVFDYWKSKLGLSEARMQGN